jgi:hypothetical protein
MIESDSDEMRGNQTVMSSIWRIKTKDNLYKNRKEENLDHKDVSNMLVKRSV